MLKALKCGKYTSQLTTIEDAIIVILTENKAAELRYMHETTILDEDFRFDNLIPSTMNMVRYLLEEMEVVKCNELLGYYEVYTN